MKDVSDSVSDATRRNWERLGVVPETKRLDRRANKRLSDRRIVPVEYLRHSQNRGGLETVVEWIDRSFPLKRDAVPPLCLDFLRHRGLVQRKAGRLSGRTVPLQRFAESLAASPGTPTFDAAGFPIDWPEDEFDFLGAIYQTLLSEGAKNRKGAYFTPPEIVADMIAGLTFGPTDRILDPACGTGAFLLSVPKGNPRNLIGFDSDPTAVLIARTNLFAAFPTSDFDPAVFLLDFLNPSRLGGDREGDPNPLWPDGPFDIIIANPPWGPDRPMRSAAGDSAKGAGERFSLFLSRAVELLKPEGRLSFLLPNAFLGVKSHSEIRRRVLDSLDVIRIREYDRKFSGVVTGVLSLTASKKGNGANKGGNSGKFLVEKKRPTIRFFIRQERFRRNLDFTFRLISEEDQGLLDRLCDRPHRTLADSVWGLGIVTGENARKLSETPRADTEPILTGKEIRPYRTDPPRRFIRFRREELQQTADETIYRARPKLIYRFIADRPIFAYDATGTLTLNSANVLIPNLEGYDVKTAAAFLNSDLFRFIYRMKFADVKVLKGNLCRLPFPEIDASANRRLAERVDAVLAGDPTAHAEIQTMIFHLFACSPEDQKRIQQEGTHKPVTVGVSSSIGGDLF